MAPATLTSTNISAQFKKNSDYIRIINDDVMNLYAQWEPPTVIVADGPYGVSGFPGDPPTHEGLADWYEPHIQQWSAKSTPETTLWFWNTEVGWATVHPILVKHGWTYRSCHIWDKGIAHIAGNANTKSLRKLPVVSEVCVQYVKKALFKIENKELSMKEWLRHEWGRTGLPLSKTNQACGVKDAATRKYFTKCHLWYYPPVEAFEKLSVFANTFGDPKGRPYFSVDGKKPISKESWERMRAKFHCPYGVTNVWQEPPVNGKERLKNGSKAIHLNQKPLNLMELIIAISSDQNDLVWEPFGGLCTAAIAARKMGRRAVAAEVSREVFTEAIKRVKSEEASNQLFKEIHDVALIGV